MKLMIFIRWLGSFVEDGAGNTSIKKMAVAMGTTSLSLGIAAMTFAKAKYVLMNGGDCSMEIAAASVPLCLMAGVAYTLGKPTERKLPDGNTPV